MGYTAGMLQYVCKDMPLKFELRKIALNTSGYTARGEYHGNGAPLYRATTEAQVDGVWEDIHLEFRASDRQDASEYVRAKYPKAKF